MGTEEAGALMTAYRPTNRRPIADVFRATAHGVVQALERQGYPSTWSGSPNPDARSPMSSLAGSGRSC